MKPPCSGMPLQPWACPPSSTAWTGWTLPHAAASWMRCSAPASAGAPRGAYAELIAAANGSGKPVVSADIPSGLNADTGELHEPCIHAAVTVCLAFLKRGLVQYPGAGAAGHVVVRSIGIPAALAREHGVQACLLTPEVLRTRLQIDVSRRRSPEGHKGTYGHVLLVEAEA